MKKVSEQTITNLKIDSTVLVIGNKTYTSEWQRFKRPAMLRVGDVMGKWVYTNYWGEHKLL